MRTWCWMAGAVVAMSLGGAAHAEPGLSNQVYEPYVKRGVTELEVRGGRLNGGPLAGESGAIVELEHGFTDRLSLAVVGELEHHAGEKTKLDSVGLEGVAYLGQIPGLGVDVGGYLEYEQRIHNESGVAEAKLLLAKRSGRFQGLLNLIAETPLTNKPGEGDSEFGYAAQATWETTPGLQLGLQAFGDLGTRRSFGGRQAHYLGPVAKWEVRPAWLKGELEFEGAYLTPIGAARDQSDGQFRFAVEIERRF